MTAKILLREGLLENIDNQWRLIGSKCKKCGRIFFPVKKICPSCFCPDLEKAILSETGKLYTYTVVYMPAEHYQAPYAVGWVELPEGIRLFSQIRGWEGRLLEIGMEMHVVVEKLWGEKTKDNEEDREVIGYTFRPLRN